MSQSHQGQARRSMRRIGSAHSAEPDGAYDFIAAAPPAAAPIG